MRERRVRDRLQTPDVLRRGTLRPHGTGSSRKAAEASPETRSRSGATSTAAASARPAATSASQTSRSRIGSIVTPPRERLEAERGGGDERAGDRAPRPPLLAEPAEERPGHDAADEHASAR